MILSVSGCAEFLNSALSRYSPPPIITDLSIRLGLMHLGAQAFDRLDDPELFEEHHDHTYFRMQRETARYAFLLHDIGHTPLSHVCEPFLDRAQLADRLIRSELIGADLKDAISRGSASPGELASCVIILEHFIPRWLDLQNDPRRKDQVPTVVATLLCRMILGIRSRYWVDNILVDLLNGAHDVDKLDYVVRDSFLTAPDLVAVRPERLIDGYTIVSKRLAVSGKALGALLNLIAGRDNMYLWVYNHHTVCYTDDLIRRYLRYLIEIDTGVHGEALQQKLVKPSQNKAVSEYYFSPEAIIQGIDDHDLMVLLKQNRDLDWATEKLCAQLFDRQYLDCLYKTIVDFNELRPREPRFLLTDARTGELERRMKTDGRLGRLEDHDIYVVYRDIKLFDPSASGSILVERNGRSISLADLLGGEPSTLVRLFQGYGISTIPFIYFRFDRVGTSQLLEYLRDYPYM